MATVTVSTRKEESIAARNARQGEFYYDESGSVVLGLSPLSLNPGDGTAPIVRMDTGVGGYANTHRLRPLRNTTINIEV